MSGLIGGISAGIRLGSGVAQSARALKGILSGAAFGGPQGVQLGAVMLTMFEVPSSVNFGGSQLVEVHKLGGGVRQVDCMGADDDAIGWQATILGPNAAARARAIDAIRQAGLTVALSWADFDFDVVVTRFRANYQRAALIPYEIECTVLADYGSTATPDVSAPGILGTVGSTLGAAAAEVGAVVSTVQTGVAAVASVVTPITSALGISVPFLGQVQAGLSQAAGLTGSVGSAAAGIAGLQATVGNIGSLAQLGVQNTAQALGLVSAATPLDQLAATAGAQAGFAYAGAQAGAAASDLSQASGVAAPVISLSQPIGISAQDSFNLIKATTPPGTTDGEIDIQQGGMNYTFINGVQTSSKPTPR